MMEVQFGLQFSLVSDLRGSSRPFDPFTLALVFRLLALLLGVAAMLKVLEDRSSVLVLLEGTFGRWSTSSSAC